MEVRSLKTVYGAKIKVLLRLFLLKFPEDFSASRSSPYPWLTAPPPPHPIMAAHQLLLLISHCLLWIWSPCLPLKETLMFTLAFPGSSDGKESACTAGDPGSIPGWEDPLKNEMAAHSSILAWKNPWMEEPGRLQSMGLQRVGHDWMTSLSFFFLMFTLGCPGGTSGKEFACQYRRCKRLGFDPWVGKIPWVGKVPWIRKWQPIPVFLRGKSHGQRKLVGYSKCGLKELDTTDYIGPI